jgi:hypothetical protein
MLNLRTNFLPTSDPVYVTILSTNKLLIHAGSQHALASITVYRAVNLSPCGGRGGGGGSKGSSSRGKACRETVSTSRYPLAVQLMLNVSEL